MHSSWNNAGWNPKAPNPKGYVGKNLHPRYESTYVDRAIDFIRRAGSARRPFYIHLWPNEVHDPFEPKAELLKKYERFAANHYVQQYYAMLDNLDQQVGRLVSAIESAGQAHNTLFVLLSDNGPTAWP